METPAEPWACPACTYRHADAEAGFLQCAMCGGTKTAEAPAPERAPAVTPAPAPAPTPSSGAAPPRKRDRDDPSSNEPPAKKKKINPFETMMAQERPVNSYLEDPASFKSGGVTGLPDVRAHTVPPVKGLVVLHDFVTADEERDLVRAVEPVLEGGNHISGAGRVHRHLGYGTENQGGYPCVMNRRAEKVWAGTPRAGTYEKVPIKGPDPPAEAPPPIPEWARPLARSIKDLGLPAFLPTRLDCLRYTPPDGQIGAHSDDPWSGPTVCLLTLAAETVMTFELKDSERKLARYRNLAPVRVRLPPRSLLVFTGDARWKFNHSIKPADIKYGATGQRILLTFRATTMPDEWSKWRCQPDGSCTAASPCALCKPPWLWFCVMCALLKRVFAVFAAALQRACGNLTVLPFSIIPLLI